MTQQKTKKTTRLKAVSATESLAGAQGGRVEVPGSLISDYLIQKPTGGDASEVILLLHGFQQTNQYIFGKLAASCPADAIVLAPNAPFPVPERKEDGSHRAGFSWYFYNAQKDEYFIDMRVGIQLLAGLLKKLDLDRKPLRVVGFSQGGYLAPFFALTRSRATQVVGVAAEFLPEELREAAHASGAPWPPHFRVDTVHGELDDIVPAADAANGHAGLLSLGARGTLIQVPGGTHRISTDVQAAVREALHRGKH